MSKEKFQHTFHGVVERGTNLAQKLGFPTANIPFDQPAISGTYVGMVLVGEQEYQAAVYANQKRKLLESYLLDFSGDLYGTPITVILLERLAEDVAFRNEQEGKDFIAQAVAAVREYCNRK